MSTGACMAQDRVWYVDQSVAVSGDGSQGSPFQTIAEALALIANGEEGTIVVATPMVHDEKVDILANRTVALRGDADGTALQFADASVVSVGSGANLFADKLRISQGSVGVICSGGSLWFDSGSIVNNTGNVAATDGGLVLLAGSVVVRNSYIGGLANAQPGVKVAQGHVELLYTTVATGVDTAAISCTDPAAKLSIRNSLIVSRINGDAIVGCSDLEITTSALEDAIPGNTALGEWNDNSWFTNFGAGDLSLNQYPPELEGAATWLSGDPTTDIDGDPRPTTDGTPDFAGADIP